MMENKNVWNHQPDGDLRTIGFWFLLSLVNGGQWDHDFIVFNQW